MNIAFNLLSTLKPKTGVGHYAARLFAALGDMLPPGTLHGFPSGRLERIVRRLLRPRASGPPAPSRPPALLSKATELVKNTLRTAGRSSLGVAFRASCQPSQFDLYHEPNFLPFPSDVPTVVTVHDLSVLLHPEWHPADRVHEYGRRFRDSLAGARHILTDTHAVRREVIEHLGVAPERVTATPLGVGPEYAAAGPSDVDSVRRDLELPANYLLYVGTIEPRKNVLTLLRAFCALPEELRRRCPLVLAGGWGWKAHDVADFLRTTAAGKGVIHLGYTDDRHLPGLYAGARALAYPSFYEGFGLPPLEMLACGGAVLSSTADALREVLVGHAHFIEPLDVDGWRDALAQAIRYDDWLAELRRGGREWAGRFRWDRCARATVEVYQAILLPARQAA